MGNLNSAQTLGKQSTAQEVVALYSGGKHEGFLAGKVAVITGGNSGIGLETCKALSNAGCRVIMGSRSVAGGLKSIEDEIKKPGNGKYIVKDVSNISVKELDLESLSSIQKFAHEVQAEEHIDYLILNAGVMAIPKCEYTENNWEKQLGINHHGHFYLTSLLKEKLAAQENPSRIVVVSSIAHTMGSVDLNDVHFTKGRNYDPWVAYGQTKMANILFAKSLADDLKDTQVTTISLHPGVIKTNLSRHLNFVLKTFVNVFFSDKDIPQGASTTLYACLNPEFAKQEMSGSYLKDCQVVLPNQMSQDKSGFLRAGLWKLTQDQINVALSKINK